MNVGRRISLRVAAVVVGAAVVSAGAFGQATPRAGGAAGGTAGRGGIGAATRPGLSAGAAAPLPEGWEEIDQRLVFLTVQLSTVESAIEATNKALRTSGYQQAIKQAAADQARQNNQAMDRNGGGPVPWQEFYGKTAERFFYHPTDGNTITVNPLPIGQRPPQFDYIYRANEQNRQKAEQDAAKLGGKIEDLLDYRRKLETEQAALWCKVAFRGVATMDLPARPLYRLDLSAPRSDEASKQEVEAAKASTAFLLAINSELGQAVKSLDDDSKTTLEHLLQVTTTARADLQTKLLKQTTLAEALSNPRTPLGQFSRSAKRLEDSAQNLVDAARLAADADSRDDQAGKQSFRGQFQQMVFDYAASVATADAAFTKAAGEWKLTPAAKPAEAAAPVDASVDAIGPRLDAAKSAATREKAAARRAFVAAIDARLNDAADAGSLERVQALESARLKAAHDGSLPEDLHDASLTAAQGTMNSAVEAANTKLVAAYREAISSYTKARRISEAQAVLDELKASGLQAGEGVASGGTPAAGAAGGSAGAVATGGFPAPVLPHGRLEVDLPAPVDEVVLANSGRYLLLHLKKLQQLAVFDISQAKVLKYIPLPSNNISIAGTSKKFFLGLRDLRQLQRWDLTKLEQELSVPAPEGGVNKIAASPSTAGPILMIGATVKRFWTVNPNTLVATKFPSKNWGTDGSAWGPANIHVSYDGSTAIACGGGWAGIEVASLRAGAVVSEHEGGYVNGDTWVAGNGSLVFPNGGGILRNDLESKVTGIDGTPFPADDVAFSLAFRQEAKKPELVLYSNGDPRPLITIRDLPELGKKSALPWPERVHLIPRAKTLLTVGEGGDRLILRSFDLAESLAGEGIDYLFVESSPETSAERGVRYSYKLVVQSRKGQVKMELQSGPKGMSLSADGVLTWAVPTRVDDTKPMVIVKVSDASGQTVFHSFTLEVGDPGSSKR